MVLDSVLANPELDWLATSGGEGRPTSRSAPCSVPVDTLPRLTAHTDNAEAAGDLSRPAADRHRRRRSSNVPVPRAADRPRRLSRVPPSSRASVSSAPLLDAAVGFSTRDRARVRGTTVRHPRRVRESAASAYGRGTEVVFRAAAGDARRCASAARTNGSTERQRRSSDPRFYPALPTVAQGRRSRARERLLDGDQRGVGVGRRSRRMPGPASPVRPPLPIGRQRRIDDAGSREGGREA